MSQYALLIDYKYCTGCHVCEVSCRKEHDIPLDEWGIKINEMGPKKLSNGHWIWDYVPVPSELCDLCADRVSKGKLPACVHNCYTGVMKYGTVEELSAELEKKSRQVLFVPLQED